MAKLNPENPAVKKRVGRPPKQTRPTVPNPEIADSTTQENSCGNGGFSIFNQSPIKDSFMSEKDSTPKRDMATVKAQAAARRETAELARAERIAERQRVKDARDAETITRKLARAEASALKSQTREAARQAALEAGGKYSGPMLGLREAKKRYVRAANGRLRSTDPLAEALDAVEPDSVVYIAKTVLGLDSSPYAHLNMGQQSMNLRNRVRTAIKSSAITIEDVIRVRDDNGLKISEDILAAREQRRAAASARKSAAASARKSAAA